MTFSIVEIALLALAGILAGAVLFAFFAKIYIWALYVGGNRVQTRNGLDGEKAANLLLEKYDLKDVKVKKANWLFAMFYGNYYNVRRKTIYLRGNIFNKGSITSVSLAVQKVALAMECNNGSRLIKFRGFIQPWVILAPVLFVPFTIIGLVVDLLLNGNIGVVSLIFFGAAFLFYLMAFIFTLVTIPIEKKANKMALKIIEETNILEGEEQNKARKIYKAYIISYIADFIMSALYILKFIYKFVLKFKRKR
jgi:hypothetical protein